MEYFQRQERKHLPLTNANFRWYPQMLIQHSYLSNAPKESGLDLCAPHTIREKHQLLPKCNPKRWIHCERVDLALINSKGQVKGYLYQYCWFKFWNLKIGFFESLWCFQDEYDHPLGTYYWGNSLQVHTLSITYVWFPESITSMVFNCHLMKTYRSVSVWKEPNHFSRVFPK